MEDVFDLLVPIDSAGKTAALPGRRLHFRHKLPTLAYINLDHANGGIVRDVSEAGLAIQAVTPLRLNQQVHLRFDVPHPKLRVEASGRVAWTDPRGQAGVQFLGLTERSRRSLKQWIFTQLLSRAQQVADAGFVFAPSDAVESAPQLLFSASPRPAIQLQPAAPAVLSGFETEPSSGAALRLSWLPFALPRRVFAGAVDALILACAVLLFAVLALSVTHISPSGLIAVALTFVVTTVFAAVYWFLFVRWMGTTPGIRLAELAISGHAEDKEEDTPRFR